MDEFTKARIDDLQGLKRKAHIDTGEDEAVAQHKHGKLTARERLYHLLDPDSFVEWSPLIGHHSGIAGAGIVAGHGTIDGRRVCVYSQDPTHPLGLMDQMHNYKMYLVIEYAMNSGVPVIGLHDSSGTADEKVGPEQTLRIDRIEDKSTFILNTQASGVVPQIAAVLGYCSGIEAYAVGLYDYVFMIDGTSHLVVTEPRIVKAVTGQDLSMEELGGAKMHSRISGVANFRMRSEEDCFQSIRKLLSFLPENHSENPPRKETVDDPDRLDDTLADIVPSDPNKGYDIRKIIRGLADNGDFLETSAEFATNMVTGFMRLDGYTIGVVANQPQVLAGCLSVNGSRKQTRHMRFCDCFNIPLLFLIDTPAYQPGTDQEHKAIIHHGAKVLFAETESTVPRINLQIRKCYGGGTLGMGTHLGLGADLTFVWPIAESGIMGAEQSVDLFYQKEIAASENPQQRRTELIKEYRKQYANPFNAISLNAGYHDAIEPRETRKRLIREFRLLRTKKYSHAPPYQFLAYTKRHGNIPL